MESRKQIFWDKILPRLQKPARYLGNEINAVVKDHNLCTQKIALAFPDLYEIGMSHLGLKILYHLVNRRDRWVAERVFMPDEDLEAIMRGEFFPLCSLETVTPLAGFDVLGFTLQYELSYTTILHMLDLAGIPQKAAERTEAHPLVIGGGPGAFNPEPLADFFDFFIIGDAEDTLPLVLEYLDQAPGESREKKLLQLTALPGVYVPSLYKEHYNDRKTYAGTFPVAENIPQRVRRAVVSNLDQAYYPTDFIVPYCGIVHDRLVLELFRGCTRGCRFCQAGIIYRPVRERTISTLLALAREMVDKTGYDELALSSLSTGDYSSIGQLINDLGRQLAKEGVSLSLPSMRLDSFSSELAGEVRRVRKSGLTFAPEAGTQRLRDVINKNITGEDLITAVTDAFAAGWSSVKLYFMLGLPTETDEDLIGIVDLSRSVFSAYRKAGGRGKPRVTVSLSVFVPKAHTPFQWAGQIAGEEIIRRQDLLRNVIKGSGLQFQWHDVKTSLLEAALARGGRHLAPVLTTAAALGCKLDSWDEHFSFSKWLQAFKENGLDLEACAARSYSLEDPLPWDHIDSGVTKEFLYGEYQRAMKEETSADCRKSCLGCGMNLLLSGYDAGKDCCP